MKGSAASAIFAAAILWGCGRPPAERIDYERTEYVMGTMLSVRVTAPTRPEAREAVDSAFALVHHLDNLLSNYQEGSEISMLARRAPEEVSVSRESFAFIRNTLTWSHKTGGALNPAIGPVVEAWGFYTEHPAVPAEGVIDSLLTCCDYRHIHLDDQSRRVGLAAGMQFDPGATGKGYALALVDTLLQERGLSAYALDFGGQVFVRESEPVVVPLRHPGADTTVLAWLEFARGSVATSGDYERYFESQGARYAHIIDPRTGWPVQGRAAVVVFACDPFVADALSTALFVGGVELYDRLVTPADSVGVMFVDWQNDTLSTAVRGFWPESTGYRLP